MAVEGRMAERGQQVGKRRGRAGGEGQQINDMMETATEV
jgi:hypothetical protein